MANVNEDIAYLSDIKGSEPVPPGATTDNIPVFGGDGKLKDSHRKLSEFYEKSDVDSMMRELSGTCDGIAESLKDEHAVSAYLSSAWAPATAYSKGEFCMYGNPACGYRCLSDHVSGEEFAPAKWKLVLSGAGKQALDGLLAKCGRDKAPLLSLADAYSPARSYSPGELAIKDGMLQICTSGAHGAGATFSTDVTIDGVMSARVDNALKDVVFSFAEPSAEIDHDERLLRYTLSDRATNSISDAVPEGYGIRLEPPAPRQVSGKAVAREFVVEIRIPESQDTPAGTSVDVVLDGECVDSLGSAAEMSAAAGRRCIYRFFEISRADGRFVVYGSLERKIFDIVLSGMFRSGIFLPDETTGLMHRVTVTRDSEHGEENVSVDKEGVVG